MALSLVETLHAVIPYIAESLVSPAAFSAVESATRLFPDFHTCTFGFESRLGVEAADADFSVLLSGDEGPGILADCFHRLSLPRCACESRLWKAIQGLGLAWSHPDSPLFGNVSHVWLEFDRDQFDRSVPVPGLFLGIADDAFSPKRSLEIIWAAVASLAQSSAAAELRGNLLACLSLLPETAYINHIGTMIARPGTSVRLNIAGLNAARAVEYLQRIGLSETSGDVGALLTTIGRYVDHFILGLNVGSRIPARIGIECYMDEQRPSMHKAGWKPLLDFLVDNGLCRQEKRNALVACAGYSNLKLDNDLWNSVVFRGINHIKITYEPNKDLEAKGYVVVIKKPWPTFSKAAIPSQRSARGSGISSDAWPAPPDRGR